MLWKRERVGWFGIMALKHVYYHMWNESPVQVRCMIQDAQGWCTGMIQRDGMGREVGRGFRMGSIFTLMVDSSQCMEKSIQYCKVKKQKQKQKKTEYCHPACLTSMQRTSCEMSGWIKHKLESSLPGEIPVTSDMQMPPPIRQKAKRN